uniref:Peptidase metallopeptidase domain-containing protein n=1 Tax=Prolemur simus TaxID=1328070 RepID=A0A8C8Z5V6_PROSS
MPSFSLLLLLLWGLGSHGFPATLETQEQDEELVQKYLENYYNLKSGINQFRRQRNSGPVVEKLKQMQKFFGLEVTGKPDAETLKVMKKPRCGVPDVGFIELTHGSYRWRRPNLTYRIKSYTSDLSREDVDHAIGKAFELWSNATDLTFTKVFEGEADIMLSFVWGDHGDNSPFYGRGSYHLAHAFPPGQHLGGDVHFNDDETWTKDFRNYNLYHVAAHELGHSLGLNHDNHIGSLMHSSYFYYGDVLLSQRNIDAIQAIIGPSKNPIPPKVLQIPQACDRKLTFDAATKIRGELFLFKDRFFIRSNAYYNDDLNFISEFWPFLRDGVEAVYEVPERDVVLFFKGSKYWITKGNQLLYRYPRDIYSSFGFPERVKRIDAAVHEEETGKTHFFVANEHWRYDENRRSMDVGYPKKIIDSFPGIGTKVDAVFHDKGFLYVFQGTKQYVLDPKTKQILNLLPSNSRLNCRNN